MSGRAEARPARRWPAVVGGPAVLVLAGCGAGSEAREPPVATSAAAWYEAALEGLGTSRAAARERHGEPEEIVVRTMENRHVAGRIDSIFEFRYPGVELEFYAVTGGRDLLQRAEISTSRRASRRPTITTPRDSVEAWLGTPAEAAADRWIYRFGEAGNALAFHFEGGAVSRIVLHPYVD